MFRFITPIILIGVAVVGFLTFTNPIYKNISVLKAESASYNEALDNAKALENERDKLTNKFNSINPDNLAKLQKLLPESVDNIRLILEIEKIAAPFGMVLRDVKYDTLKKETGSAPVAIQNNEIDPMAGKDFGTWSLEFSTSSSYSNFINFLKALEKNLRIVDVSSISFSSNVSPGINPALFSSEVYKYDFKINTYWLKN